MSKIKSLADLKAMKEHLQYKLDLREKSENSESLVQIKVSMATCGIASGAKDIMNFMITELEKRNIDAVVTQTGCMGYCYAEPTIEVSRPGQEAVVFGYVDKTKADQIIEKFIKNNEMVEGIIPKDYHDSLTEL
ncbi:MAG: hypothetical protein RIS47_734 [Bacteroidota bacterium]|jgi:NADP-reducing hydrogenase subunit HndB